MTRLKAVVIPKLNFKTVGVTNTAPILRTVIMKISKIKTRLDKLGKTTLILQIAANALNRYRSAVAERLNIIPGISGSSLYDIISLEGIFMSIYDYARVSSRDQHEYSSMSGGGHRGG